MASLLPWRPLPKSGAALQTGARELAETERDPIRREELLGIAKACDRVPAHPPRTFLEALQAMWFVHILHWWETRNTAAVSPGRVDQYLYPFYQRDLEEGNITEADAQELIDAFLLEILPVQSRSGRGTLRLSWRSALGQHTITSTWGGTSPTAATRPMTSAICLSRG